MFYERQGSGEPLLLLHAAAAANPSWSAQLDTLAERYEVILAERRGHGRTADVEGPITYQQMAADMTAFMERLGITSAHLVGWSDGSDVAMVMGAQRPDLVRSLVLINGNFALEGIDPGVLAEAATMSADDWAPESIADYARLSPDGPEHWPVMFEKVRTLLTTEPDIDPDALTRIDAPTLVVAGERDLVTLEHTIALYRRFPNAQLFIVPGATHSLTREKPELVNRVILDFLAQAS
jgi:pimeloyl-ACP methyl ester carboxylesterase